MSFFKRLVLILCLTLAVPVTVCGQVGVSSASMGVARSGFHRVGSDGRYCMPTADLFRVEEFINYHRHDLPLPKSGQRIRLNVRKMATGSKSQVVQIGLVTPREVPRSEVPPLNLVLVVDRSGSMRGSKMSHLKQAIRELVENFRKEDRITIVGFSSDAYVHLEPACKTDQSRIKNAIQQIHAGGGTNLFAGLKLGFQQAEKHFDPERTNRVIFLTDGNANVGVTETETISKLSRQCHAKGISLTTIGLGVDFNNGLLRDLADAGRGVIHYIGDAKDIQKSFVREVESLIAPAARNVKLTLDLDDAEPKVLGYRPQQKKDSRCVIKLDDLNCGATQVVLVKVPQKSCAGKVQLSYQDALTQKRHEVEIDLGKVRTSKEELRSVRRNYAIGLIATSIKKAAIESNQQDHSAAIKKLRKGIAKAKANSPKQNDKHVARVMKIAKDYLQRLVGDDADDIDS